MTVFTNDGTLLAAIADGRCGLGLVDSNVLAALLYSKQDAPVAVRWFDDPSGTLADISGGGVTRHAKNPEAALQLLEWLASSTPNALFATLRYEFPANPASETGRAIAAWPHDAVDLESLSDLGFLLEEADRLIERARYP